MTVTNIHERSTKAFSAILNEQCASDIANNVRKYHAAIARSTNNTGKHADGHECQPGEEKRHHQEMGALFYHTVNTSALMNSHSPHFSIMVKDMFSCSRSRNGRSTFHVYLPPSFTINSSLRLSTISM